jgi:hypothetical protein
MLRRLFLMAFTAASLALTASAQVPPDRVHYRDRAQEGKVVTVEGEAKETAASVQVIGPDKKVKATISAPDMVRIDYGTLVGIDRTAQLAATTIEANGDAAKSLAAFKSLATNSPGALSNAKSKRYLDFRDLTWSAKVTDAKVGDDFKTEGKKIADRLLAFAKANAASWECWSTARTAARYLCELDESAAAADAMAILGGNAGLTPELRGEARLIEIGYLFRANKRLDADNALKALAADKDFPATGPLRERWTIFDEVVKAPAPPPERKETDPPTPQEEVDARVAKVKEAAAKIEVAIAKAKDASARGAGYSALGELLVRHGLMREAMWAYLWVDVVYNQDHDEQVKAVNRLVRIFGALKEKDKSGDGEKDRAETYRDRLPRIRD